MTMKFWTSKCDGTSVEQVPLFTVSVRRNSPHRTQNRMKYYPTAYQTMPAFPRQNSDGSRLKRAFRQLKPLLKHILILCFAAFALSTSVQAQHRIRMCFSRGLSCRNALFSLLPSLFWRGNAGIV